MSRTASDPATPAPNVPRPWGVSNSEQREYGGNVYASNGVFSFSAGQVGEPCTATGCFIYINEADIPSGADLVGSYHTHPDIGQGASGFSSLDIESNANHNPPLYAFMGTAFNQVLMFDPNRLAGFMNSFGPPPVCVLSGGVLPGQQGALTTCH
jgi:hypothetical protein